MIQTEIQFEQQGTINAIESLKVLKATWEEEKASMPTSEEATGQVEDRLLEIVSTYDLLEQAVQSLLESTIDSLEKTEEAMTETDERLGEAIGE